MIPACKINNLRQKLLKHEFFTASGHMMILNAMYLVNRFEDNYLTMIGDIYIYIYIQLLSLTQAHVFNSILKFRFVLWLEDCAIVVLSVRGYIELGFVKVTVTNEHPRRDTCSLADI